MADRIILRVSSGDPRGWEIIEAFAERSGLEIERREDEAEFPLSGSDHSVPVVQTLTEIDPEWTQHVSLGDPAAAES